MSDEDVKAALMEFARALDTDGDGCLSKVRIPYSVLLSGFVALE